MRESAEGGELGGTTQRRLHRHHTRPDSTADSATRTRLSLTTPMKRPKPKDRRTDRRCPCDKRTDKPRRDEPIFAPSHLGGQFEEAGYSTGQGVFGFRQDVNP